jgi:hypothetical protein
MVGQFQCTVVCWYVSNQFTSSCAVILEPTIVPSASSELASFLDSSPMHRTPWHPIAACAIAPTSQCSYLSQCFVVMFCINLFLCLQFKKFIFVNCILWRIAPELYDFSTHFNAVLFVHRLMTKDVMVTDRNCVLYDVNILRYVQVDRHSWLLELLDFYNKKWAIFILWVFMEMN